MGFDHNEHYHELLIREIPEGAKKALDVGCGTGAFARRLAGRGLEVDAIDTSAILDEEGMPPTVRFRRCDITTAELPERHYDVIFCPAFPFGRRLFEAMEMPWTRAPAAPAGAAGVRVGAHVPALRAALRRQAGCQPSPGPSSVAMSVRIWT
ncbi:class I SAM-dependent methyltransferase [Nonomuraea sp. NPDC049421]|uniref:class I SAM-dependent methyltransferase n=1 Tax=Nonomuraea sp. NPDC049421 TaxID=3155275 RepID=UPI00343BAC83